MAYCTYCGTKNREGALFCKNCGKPMSEPKEDNNVEQPAEEEAVVEEQIAVEEQVEEHPTTNKASVVEIPIETTAAAPQQVAPQPVVTPVVPPVAPKQKVAPVQDPSDLMERMAKPRNKGRITIILLIPLFLALIGLGVGAFFLFKAANKVKDEVNTTVEAINNDNDKSSDDAVANEDDSAEEAEETEATEETVQEEIVEEETEATTEAKAPRSASLSTKARPSISDFQGWFVNNAMRTGKPGGVHTLSTLSEISGSWKALFFLDPTNRTGDKAQTFGTLTIEESNEKIKIHLKRYYTHFFNGSEISDESSEAPDFFSARWKSGRIIASGAGSLTLTDFWEQGGKQYAIGTLDSPDGVSVAVGLVRP